MKTGAIIITLKRAGADPVVAVTGQRLKRRSAPAGYRAVFGGDFE